MGNDYQIYGNGFFMVVSLLAGIAITIWSRTAKAGADRTLSIALGMILGGTLGNLFDRIVFHGVRDFCTSTGSSGQSSTWPIACSSAARDSCCCKRSSRRTRRKTSRRPRLPNSPQPSDDVSPADEPAGESAVQIEHHLCTTFASATVTADCASFCNGFG